MAKTICPNCGETTTDNHLSCNSCGYTRSPGEEFSTIAIQRMVNGNYPAAVSPINDPYFQQNSSNQISSSRTELYMGIILFFVAISLLVLMIVLQIVERLSAML